MTSSRKKRTRRRRRMLTVDKINQEALPVHEGSQGSVVVNVLFRANIFETTHSGYPYP